MDWSQPQQLWSTKNSTESGIVWKRENSHEATVCISPSVHENYVLKIVLFPCLFTCGLHGEIRWRAARPLAHNETWSHEVGHASGKSYQTYWASIVSKSEFMCSSVNPVNRSALIWVCTQYQVLSCFFFLLNLSYLFYYFINYQIRSYVSFCLWQDLEWIILINAPPRPLIALTNSKNYHLSQALLMLIIMVPPRTFRVWPSNLWPAWPAHICNKLLSTEESTEISKTCLIIKDEVFW